MRFFLRKVCFLVLFFLVCPPFFSEESLLDEFFFEVSRYSIAGFSVPRYASYISGYSRLAARFLSRYCIRKNPDGTGISFVLTAELEHPERIGCIESSFCPEDTELNEVRDSGANDSDFFEGIPGYNGFIGTGDWIDQVLRSVSFSDLHQFDDEAADGRRILDMLEGNDGRGIEETEVDAETGFEELACLDKDGLLRRFSFGEEQFAVSKENEHTLLVSGYGDKIVRRVFDGSMRLIRTEKFRTGQTAKQLVCEEKKDYFYSGDSSVPVRSVAEFMTTGKVVAVSYLENGLPGVQEESHYENMHQKGGSSDDGKKEAVRDRKISFTYDSESNVIEENVVSWYYAKSASGKRQSEEVNVRTVYTYREHSSDIPVPPDVDFYENGELRLRRMYESADDYSELLFFDGNFSVEIVYTDGIKRTEILYLDGVEQRRRDFE